MSRYEEENGSAGELRRLQRCQNNKKIISLIVKRREAETDWDK